MFRKSTTILASMLGVATAVAAHAAPLDTAASAPAQTAPSQASTPTEPSLAAVRAATERFRDVKVALAEGYIRDPFDLCDTADTAKETGQSERSVRLDAERGNGPDHISRLRDVGACAKQLC